MPFRGWSDEALEFFEGLAADNSKTYWTAHKAVYEDRVLAPMQALLADLEPEFGAGKIFRPYRDTRFSKDKSPYKTSIAASLAGGGYLQLTADGLGAGSGMWHIEPAQLAAYRSAVDDPGTGGELVRIIQAVARHGVEVSARDRLVHAPRGYPKDHPRVDLLRNKGLVAWKQWPPAAWLGTATAQRRVVEFLRAARPLHDWLAIHVGQPDDTG